MITAIYARKSTGHGGVADEQKSVARQVEQARAYAIAKRWTIDEAHVYIDDGISGAEFASRPGFLRLMNALKPRPSFNVCVMSEESHLGHEAIRERIYPGPGVPLGTNQLVHCPVRSAQPAAARASR